MRKKARIMAKLAGKYRVPAFFVNPPLLKTTNKIAGFEVGGYGLTGFNGRNSFCQ